MAIKMLVIVALVLGQFCVTQGGDICKIKLPCKIVGGSCVTNSNECGSGRLIQGGCGGKIDKKSCQCCVPDQVGPQGPPGPSGPAGPQGPQGPPGSLTPVKMDMYEISILGRGGIAKASSSHSSGNYNPIKAIDRLGGFWHSGWINGNTVPQTLWVEFPIHLHIVKYSFTSRIDVGPYSKVDGPSKYIFWGSQDRDCTNEATWVILNQDFSGAGFNEYNSPKSAVIPVNKPFRCYGFKVLDVIGRSDGIKPVTMANIRFWSVGPPF